MRADNTLVIESSSAEKTLAFGQALGERLMPGDVLGLVGPLGAGKTVLAKGVARGLGVLDEARVNSPTFVLVNEYQGRLRMHHMDAFRLSGPRELDGLGFDEMCSAGGVVLVEWADRVAEAITPEALWIDFEITGESRRRLSLRTESASLRRRVARCGLDRER